MASGKRPPARRDMESRRQQAIHQDQGRQATSGSSDVRQRLRVSSVGNYGTLKAPGDKVRYGFRSTSVIHQDQGHQATSGDSDVGRRLRVSSLLNYGARKAPIEKAAIWLQVDIRRYIRIRGIRRHLAIATSGDGIGFPSQALRRLEAAE